MTKREDIFIQILIVCGEENQHLSARERTKKNAAQTSDASLEQYRSFRAVFTGNASVVEETCALTFCLFFNTKSMQGEKIFLYSEFGGVLLYTLQRKEEMRKKNPHPQRAVNAKTVVVASDREEREERLKREEERALLCLRIPDDDEEEEEDEQIQKEEMTVRKGAKRKRAYECDVCEKAFRYPSKLAEHMRIHTKEKPYECDVCDKAFRDSGHLKIHMRIHTNEKPYECDVCEKRFRISSNLRRHVRTQR